MPDTGASLVSVYRNGKLLRYEDNEGKTVAIVSQGRLKVTSHGMISGYYVRANKLRREGEEAYTGKPLVNR